MLIRSMFNKKVKRTCLLNPHNAVQSHEMNLFIQHSILYGFDLSRSPLPLQSRLADLKRELHIIRLSYLLRSSIHAIYIKLHTVSSIMSFHCLTTTPLNVFDTSTFVSLYKFHYAIFLALPVSQALLTPSRSSWRFGYLLHQFIRET